MQKVSKRFNDNKAGWCVAQNLSNIIFSSDVVRATHVGRTPRSTATIRSKSSIKTLTFHRVFACVAGTFPYKMRAHKNQIDRNVRFDAVEQTKGLPTGKTNRQRSNKNTVVRAKKNSWMARQSFIARYSTLSEREGHEKRNLFRPSTESHAGFDWHRQMANHLFFSSNATQSSTKVVEEKLNERDWNCVTNHQEKISQNLLRNGRVGSNENGSSWEHKMRKHGSDCSFQMFSWLLFGWSFLVRMVRIVH